MCKVHPSYKAIRRPKPLKLTGQPCPECVQMYLQQHAEERRDV